MKLDYAVPFSGGGQSFAGEFGEGIRIKPVNAGDGCVVVDVLIRIPRSRAVILEGRGVGMLNRAVECGFGMINEFPVFAIAYFVAVDPETVNKRECVAG